MSKIRIGETLAKAGTTIEVPIEIYFIESNITSPSSYDIIINYSANNLDLIDNSKDAIKQTLENNSIINFIPIDTVAARKDVTLWKRFMPPLPRLLGGLFAGLLMVH